MRSISEMGAMLTIFTTGIKPGLGNKAKEGLPTSTNKSEENLVMDTKLKIIDILQFILDVRLDYRISSLLSIFKHEFDESSDRYENKQEIYLSCVLMNILLKGSNVKEWWWHRFGRNWSSGRRNLWQRVGAVKQFYT